MAKAANLPPITPENILKELANHLEQDYLPGRVCENDLRMIYQKSKATVPGNKNILGHERFFKNSHGIASSGNAILHVAQHVIIMKMTKRKASSSFVKVVARHTINFALVLVQVENIS
jgi:hypothetical protein